MTDLNELIGKYPWHIQCLYHQHDWETLAVFATSAQAEKELHRYMVSGRDRSLYRIIDISTNH